VSVEGAAGLADAGWIAAGLFSVKGLASHCADAVAIAGLAATANRLIKSSFRMAQDYSASRTARKSRGG
jgi:hypothetical protein